VHPAKDAPIANTSPKAAILLKIFINVVLQISYYPAPFILRRISRISEMEMKR